MENKHWVQDLINSKYVLILVSLIFVVLFIVVCVGLFTDKHINLLGIEFNAEKKVIVIDNTEVKKEKTEETINEKDKIVKEKVTTQKSVINSDNKNNIGSVKATNLQIGDNNIQNIGIQAREINEEYLKDFFINFPDKNIHIGFVGATGEGEIIKVKNQIIQVLESNGYHNIESTNGIRLMLNDNLSTEKLTLLPNHLGGISFYIPSAQ